MKNPSTTISEETTSSLYAGVKAEGELLIDIGSSEFVTSELANLVTEVCPSIVDFLNKLARGEVTKNTATLSVLFPEDTIDDAVVVGEEHLMPSTGEQDPTTLSSIVPGVVIHQDLAIQALEYATITDVYDNEARLREVLLDRIDMGTRVRKALNLHPQQVNRPSDDVIEYEEKRDDGIFTYRTVKDFDGDIYIMSLPTSTGMLTVINDTTSRGPIDYIFKANDPVFGGVNTRFGRADFTWNSGQLRETIYSAAIRQLKPAQLKSLISHLTILKADVNQK